MTRYRIEVYDGAFNFISHAEVSKKTVNIDYLVLGTSSVTVAEIISVSENNFITLKANGKELYAGLVTSVSYGEHSTVITVRSFMSLLDTDVMIDYTRSENEYLEDLIAEKIRQMYSGTDSTQAITGFSVVVNSQTLGSLPEEYTSNLHELCVYLLKKYGIILKFVLSVPNKTLTLNIGKIDTNDVKIIKASVSDVTECVVDVRSIQSDYNKAVYYDETDLTSSLTYYLHTDGTIDTTSTGNRFYPVVQTEIIVAPDDDHTFQQAAYEDALSTLSTSEYENEISVTVKAESNIIEIGDIGQIYAVINYDGTVYTSILTGFVEVNPLYVTLQLGYVRTDLTSILKMQRRTNK